VDYADRFIAELVWYLIVPVLAVIRAERTCAIALGALAERIWDFSVAVTYGTGIQVLVASFASSHFDSPFHSMPFRSALSTSEYLIDA
jgi:hypothetical protein